MELTRKVTLFSMSIKLKIKLTRKALLTWIPLLKMEILGSSSLITLQFHIPLTMTQRQAHKPFISPKICLLMTP